MPVVRNIIAHDNSEDAQWLKIDNSARYIENHSEDWQFIFNADSAITNSQQVVKISAEFNKVDLNSIYTVAYLYNQITGGVDNAGTCNISYYKVANPNWTESLLYSTNTTKLPNQYFYVNTSLNSLPGVDFEGGDVIRIEVSITRSGYTFRDRIYINHLGVYDSIIRLRNDVEFLDLTKVDE